VPANLWPPKWPSPLASGRQSYADEKLTSVRALWLSYWFPMNFGRGCFAKTRGKSDFGLRPSHFLGPVTATVGRPAFALRAAARQASLT
jgi:hypothetical protein